MMIFYRFFFSISLILIKLNFDLVLFDFCFSIKFNSISSPVKKIPMGREVVIDLIHFLPRKLQNLFRLKFIFAV